MARKRMIDPDIWTDERFAFLDEAQQILFVALFSQADDEGRLEWSATKMKLRCFPASPHPASIFDDRKSAIVQVGLAHEYESDGRVYLLLPGWFKTQKLDHPSPSKLPDPQDLRTNSALREYSRDLASIRENSRGVTKGPENSRERASTRGKLSKYKVDQDKLKEKKKIPSGSIADVVFCERIEPEVQTYIKLAAAHNHSGKITSGRIATERRELAEALAEIGDEETFLTALREANRHEAPNVNYVRRVAENTTRRASVTPLHASGYEPPPFPPDRIFR